MGTYDVMQVCLNGHVITENYNSSPEFRKKFCTECGEPTITKCLNCQADIPGDYHVPGVVYLGTDTPVAPKICAECGNKFPWYDAVMKEREEREKARKEKEKQDRLKGAKIEVKVDGHGNVVNLGDIIDSTIENTIKLKEIGNSDVAKGLKNLANAVNEANDIQEAEKKKYLEQIKMLSEQALLDENNRMPKAALEPIINFGLGGLSSIGSIASIWGAWGDTIKTFFLGV